MHTCAKDTQRPGALRGNGGGLAQPGGRHSRLAPPADPIPLADWRAEAQQAGWDGIFLEDYTVCQGQVDMATCDPWATMAATLSRVERLGERSPRICVSLSVTRKSPAWCRLAGRALRDRLLRH